MVSNPRSSQTRSGYRPLPLPPGASSPASFGPVSIPEPELYYTPGTPPARPNRGDSFTSPGGSSDLLKMATTGSMRRAFESPNGAPGDQLPEYAPPPSPPSSFLDFSSSPVASRHHPYGTTEWSPDSEYPSPVAVTRMPSSRPVGTLAPSIPAQNSNTALRNGFDAHANDGSIQVNGYHLSDNSYHRSLDPAHRGHSPAPPQRHDLNVVTTGPSETSLEYATLPPSDFLSPPSAYESSYRECYA
jgi:hypothetical protein